MKVITTIDPFTYAVHRFKEVILKNTGLLAILPDLLILLTFSVVSMGVAPLLLRRTL